MVKFVDKTVGYEEPFIFGGFLEHEGNVLDVGLGLELLDVFDDVRKRDDHFFGFPHEVRTPRHIHHVHFVHSTQSSQYYIHI